jgi:hypothetical protein
MTRSQAIKAYCFDCSDSVYSDVRNCKFTGCALYLGRQGKRPKGYQPSKQIRKHCLYCMNGSEKEVRECTAHDCPLWIYRMGKVSERPSKV